MRQYIFIKNIGFCAGKASAAAYIKSMYRIFYSKEWGGHIICIQVVIVFSTWTSADYKLWLAKITTTCMWFVLFPFYNIL